MQRGQWFDWSHLNAYISNSTLLCPNGRCHIKTLHEKDIKIQRHYYLLGSSLVPKKAIPSGSDHRKGDLYTFTT